MRSYPETDPSTISRLKVWSVCLAIGVITIALLVLAGWQCGIVILIRPLPGLAAMNPMSAIAFMHCGLSMLFWLQRYRVAGWAAFGKFLAMIVLGISLPRLSTSFLPRGWRIDHILYPVLLENDARSSHSNDTAINTAGAFLLSAVALWRQHARGMRRTLMVQSLAIAISLLFSSPGKGIMVELIGSLTGSVMARELIPFAIIVPAVLGWLRLGGRWIIVDSIKDYAIIRADPDGIIVSWNEGAQAIKGYTANAIIGRHISVFYPKEDIAKGVPEKNLELAQEYGHFNCEGWRIRKDGSRFWADVVFPRIYGDDGQLKGFANITRDVTKRKQAQEKLTTRPG